MQPRFEDRYIMVNVPDQTVKLISHGEVQLESRAIVGRTGSKTPIARMMVEALILNPPQWHVPEDTRRGANSSEACVRTLKLSHRP